MGSKVIPYFILNAEKVTNPKEIAEIEQEQLLKSFRQTPTAPPITPAPSGLSAPSEEPICLVNAPKKKRKLIKYKIPVKALRKRSTLNTRMELIKEKLEKSRERFMQKKDKSLLKEPNDNCVPTVIGLNGEVEIPPPLDRSVSDLTAVRPKKNADGTFPYVYFVVTDNKVTDTETDEPKGEGEKVKKSASKKRRVRIVEDKKEKLDKKEQMAKMQGLARELGLKSVVDPKPPDSNARPQASVNQIVFPDTIAPQQKSKHANELPTTKSNLHSIHHSPTRVPPGTPATYLSDKTGEHRSPDVDESVPRKPFLSGPLYAGKNRSLHSCSLQTFELPNISPEQKRRALGLGSSINFDEFAYPKPKSEPRDRKVSFADQLPVIRGSGFVFSGNEARDDVGPELPSLGPRAHTVGTITLPSERVDKQTLCQRFLLNENVASARTMRRSGVPMPLPKIDIVSNVYDEMIIKMIQEYLQVSNTPSRQSQLAKELLVHLQKHNDNMREINVPTVNITRESALRAEQESAQQLHKKARRAIFREMDLYPPPNTAEGDTVNPPKQMTPLCSEAKFVIPEDTEAPTEQETRTNNVEECEENMPIVEVTIRSKNESEILPDEQTNVETILESDNQLPRSAKSGRSLKSRERPELSPITPVSFQMAPPGLSKEDTNLSLKT